ncbi:MAG TPA: biotin/lipoyl-binding protein [Acidimicrobiia bacterium]|nr:biotin/lipoyl-binding protein [Acidimicrobiia bacterium]
MRKHLVLNGSLVAVAVAIGVGAYANIGSGASTTATRSTVVTAKRGVVLSTVTATGNVEAPTNLGVSFQQTAKVTSISVHAGDHVTAGQELARVDDTLQFAALTSAQASLASAQASLAAKLRGETSFERAQDAAGAASAAQSVANAQAAVTHALQTASQNADKYQLQIYQAQAQLDAAGNTVTSANAALDRAKSSMATLQVSYDSSGNSSENADTRASRYKLDQVSCSAHSGTPGYHTADGVDCSQITNLISFATNVQAAQTSATQAQASVTTAQNLLTTAQQNQTSGKLQDQQSVDNAQNSLTAANLQYQSTLAGNAVKQQPAKPEDLAQSRASVASAQQQLASAQKNEDDTILQAPVSGTVASVSGTVGQYSSSGGSGSGSSSGSSTGSSAASSSSTSSTASSSFVDLTDVRSLDVKVGFTETDAPKIRVGGAATITLDALTGQTLTGTVLSLDTNQTVVSNVVTYYAKVGFDSLPARVKPGMTASVAVVLDKRDNAVTLPTSAVPTSGTTATVTVRSGSSDTSRSITLGLRGDNAVEITSGLSAGEQIVVRSAAASVTSGGLPGGGAGRGVGGGGGLGGGGIGGGR